MDFEKEGTTYKQEQVTDPERKISVEIGDSKQDEFFPQIKTLFWDNECNISMRLVDPDYSKGVVIEKGELIEWEQGNRIARFYLKEPDNHLFMNGGFAFDVEFKSMPASNIVEFTLETKEFDFFKQTGIDKVFPVGSKNLAGVEVASATETECFDVNGKVIAATLESMVGGYVIKHKTKRNRIVGKKDYGTGDVGVIPRPFVRDANGVQVWCDQSIVDNVLRVEIPDDFRLNATYPIIVDPDVGYTTAGGSSSGIETVIIGQPGTSAGAGTGVSVSCYAKEDDTANTHPARGNVYLDSASDTEITNGQTGEVQNLQLAAGWITIAFAVAPSIAASTAYWAAFWIGPAAGQASIYFNVNTSSGASSVGHTYPTWPSPITFVNAGVDISLYFSYNEASGSLIKTKKGLAIASDKVFKGLAIASVKVNKGLTNV